MPLRALSEELELREPYGLVREEKLMPAKGISMLRDSDIGNCRHGCAEYGRHFSCPPYAPKPSEASRLVGTYSDAMLVVLEGRLDRQDETNSAMSMLEYYARAHGFARARSFFVYPCTLCGGCPHEPDGSGKCASPAYMRPTVDTFVDVFKTLQNAGVPFRRYADGEPFDMMSLVLLE